MVSTSTRFIRQPARRLRDPGESRDRLGTTVTITWSTSSVKRPLYRDGQGFADLDGIWLDRRGAMARCARFSANRASLQRLAFSSDGEIFYHPRRPTACCTPCDAHDGEPARDTMELVEPGEIVFGTPSRP